MSQCTSCMVAFHRHRYYEPRETDSPAHRIATAMRIAIASDHAAVELTSALVQWLREQDHEITVLGPHGAASVDYPPYGYNLSNSLATGSALCFIAFCCSSICLSPSVLLLPPSPCSLFSFPLSPLLS